jgi:hypothetical protein
MFYVPKKSQRAIPAMDETKNIVGYKDNDNL